MVKHELNKVCWPVRTARLAFRPATPEDIDATWVYRRLPEVGEWLPRFSLDRESYAAAFIEPVRLERTLTVECDGVVVGDLYVAIGDAHAQAEVGDGGRGVQAEIGWVLDPSYGGQGLATEAVEALIRVCFVDLGMRRVQAVCFAENVPSWRLMERIGMRREGHTLRDSLHRSGRWLDCFHYAMLAEEWRPRS